MAGLAGLAALAVLAAYLMGAGGGGRAAAAAEDASGDRRTLVMVGHGEVEVVPDELSFRLSVQATRPELRTALGAGTGTMRRVLAVLDRLRVARADVRTTGLTMNPVYDYSDDHAVLVGYRVTQTATVRVRDLARGGEAVAEVVEAGGNAVRVSGIRLEVSDPDRAQARAREAAVEDARTKAEQYAAAAGETLGQVLSLQEVGAGAPYPVATAQRALSAAELADVPIRAGRSEQSVRVQVVWELA